MLGKVIGWGIFLLVLWWIVANPHQAAAAVNGLGTFFSSVVHHGS